MKIEVLEGPRAVARTAATLIANQARQAIAKRGRFVVAFSGGSTPWQMLRDLAGEEVPWKDVYVVQVDERVAPAGDPARNLTQLQESLLSYTPLPREQVYAMPVEADDLFAAAAAYSQTLEQVAGSPPVLNRARNILWLVTGDSKSEMLQRLRRADATIPAGRVRQDAATIFADRAAAERG